MDPEDALPADAAAETMEGDDPWHEEGWFFDLPDGAWERQEAKNRALRQNIRVNAQRTAAIRALESRRDPFVARDPLAALAQHEDGPAWGEEMDDTPVSQQPSDGWRADDEPTPRSPDTEEAAWPAQSAWQAEEPEADEAWGAPTDFLERRTGPRRAGSVARQHASAWNPGSEEREPIPLRPLDHLAPADTGTEAAPGADERGPRSRWDEMFGGPGELSIVEAMRDWSAHAHEEEQRHPDLSELPPELLKPFDWEEAEEMERPPADEPVVVESATEPAEPSADGTIEPPGTPAESAELDDPPALTRAEAAPVEAHHPPRRPGVFGRLFARKQPVRAAEADDWRLDVDPPQGDTAAGTGAVAETSAAWVAGDDEPGGAISGAAGGAEEPPIVEDLPEHAPPGPVPGTWGAPPTDGDGSLKYELPRRFTSRDVWEDDWFERPPAEDAAGSPGEHVGPAETGQTGIASEEPAGEPTVRPQDEAAAGEDVSADDTRVSAESEASAEPAEVAAAAVGAPAAKREENSKEAGADGWAETGDAEGEAWEASECAQAATTGEPSEHEAAGEAPTRAPRAETNDDPWAAFLASNPVAGTDAFTFASDRDTRLAS